MNFRNSSIEDPIGFFEDYFRKNGILKHFEEYKYWRTKEQIAHPESVRIVIIDNDCIIERKEYNYALDDDGNLITEDRIENIDIDFFSKEAERLIKSEVEKSKTLLKNASKIYLQNHNDASKFLNFQSVLIEEIQQDCSELFNRFPFCMDYLNAFKNYIHNLLISILKGVDTNQLSLSSKQFHSDYKNALIHEIFDFWKLPTNNGKGPIIMEEKEHERLISLIIEMIKEEKSPKIEVKFKELPISKYLITYCFYILKTKLYGVKRGKIFFTEFLPLAFVDLPYKKEYFDRKFSAKPNYENWYPQIIKDTYSEK